MQWTSRHVIWQSDSKQAKNNGASHKSHVIPSQKILSMLRLRVNWVNVWKGNPHLIIRSTEPTFSWGNLLKLKQWRSRQCCRLLLTCFYASPCGHCCRQVPGINESLFWPSLAVFMTSHLVTRKEIHGFKICAFDTLFTLCICWREWEVIYYYF